MTHRHRRTRWSPARVASSNALALALVLAVALGGCRPKASAEDALLIQPDPACAFELLPGPLPEGTQAALHRAGKGIGLTRAQAPAAQYTERQTGDGYLVRRAASTLVMIFAGIGIGALLAALALTLTSRRPTPRWAERLGQAIAKEIGDLRAMIGGSDPLAAAIVGRFEEALERAAKKAQQLVTRAQPLERRAESTTAVAHLASLEARLEGMLARIERIHLQIHAWHERQLHAEDEAVKAQVAAAIAELESALEETA